MYAVNVESNGKTLYVPLGNDGLQKLHGKDLQAWKRETYIMRHNGGDVYVIRDFTQKMCEMNQGKLVDHIMANYICLLPKVTPEEVMNHRKEQDDED